MRQRARAVSGARSPLYDASSKAEVRASALVEKQVETECEGDEKHKFRGRGSCGFDVRWRARQLGRGEMSAERFPWVMEWIAGELPTLSQPLPRQRARPSRGEQEKKATVHAHGPVQNTALLTRTDCVKLLPCGWTVARVPFCFCCFSSWALRAAASSCHGPSELLKRGGGHGHGSCCRSSSHMMRVTRKSSASSQALLLSASAALRL